MGAGFFPIALGMTLALIGVAVVWTSTARNSSETGVERVGWRPPPLHELAASIEEPPERIELALEQSVRLGRVVRVSRKRWYMPEALRKLGAIVREVAESDGNGEVSAIAFRDRCGIGRNVSIEVLEFFDRVRFTRRCGNVRRVVRPLGEVFTEDEPRQS